MTTKNIIKISVTLLLLTTSALGATPTDLQHQSARILDKYFYPKPAIVASSMLTDKTSVNIVRTETDSTHTTHTRMQEIFSGLPVWGADFIVHTPQAANTNLKMRLENKRSTMNGMLYLDLEKDLNTKPAFNELQKTKAIKLAKEVYKKNNSGVIRDESISEIIFISEDNKAHYVYKVSFLENTNSPHRPVFIIDAATLTIYKTWDDIRTYEMHKVISVGGNETLGKILYDGTPEHLPAIDMYVDNNQCLYENDQFKVRSFSDHPLQTACTPVDPGTGLFKLNNFDTLDSANGAYSPASDALYAANLTAALYQQWYGTPVVLDKNNQTKSAKIPLRVHMSVFGEPYVNAAYDPKEQDIVFGDGDNDTYPLVSLEIVAHELSHGFTSMHSDLVYTGESGGLNESFSDMAAKAVEFFQSGKNQWTLGTGIIKNGYPLRYMDDPKKDGKSIDNINDYNSKLDVHKLSGIYNKIFYILATKNNWNTKMAFDLMVTANRYYWLPTSNFHSAACGVMSAAKQFNFPITDVKDSFFQVGIDTTDCADADPIDHNPSNNPECPFTKDLSPLSWDQLPCHTYNHSADGQTGDVKKNVNLPIMHQNHQILLVNNSNHNLSATILITYAEYCDMDNIEQWGGDVEQPKYTNKRIVLQKNESAVVPLSSNCLYPKIYDAPLEDTTWAHSAAYHWGTIKISMENSVYDEEVSIIPQ